MGEGEPGGFTREKVVDSVSSFLKSGSPFPKPPPFPDSVRDKDAFLAAVKDLLADLSFYRFASGRMERSEKMEEFLGYRGSLRFGTPLLDRASTRLPVGSSIAVVQGENSPNFDRFVYPFLLLLSVVNRKSLALRSLFMTKTSMLSLCGSIFPSSEFVRAMDMATPQEIRMEGIDASRDMGITPSSLGVFLLDSAYLGDAPLSSDTLDLILSRFLSSVDRAGTYGVVVVRRDTGIRPELIMQVRVRIPNVMDFFVERNSTLVQFSGFMTPQAYTVSLERIGGQSSMLNILSATPRGREFF